MFYTWFDSWHSLDELYKVVTWNGFQQSRRSNQICWALVSFFAFTRWSISSQTILIWFRSADCGSHASFVCFQFGAIPQQYHTQSTLTPLHLLLHASLPHHHYSMLHGKNHACKDHLLTFLRHIETRQLKPKISNFDTRPKDLFCLLHSLAVFFFSTYVPIKAWFMQSLLNSWCGDVSTTRTLCGIHLGSTLRCRLLIWGWWLGLTHLLSSWGDSWSFFHVSQFHRSAWRLEWQHLGTHSKFLQF